MTPTPDHCSLFIVTDKLQKLKLNDTQFLYNYNKIVNIARYVNCKTAKIMHDLNDANN